MWKNKKNHSPVKKAAASITKKYRGRRMTPDHRQAMKQALLSVSNKKMSIRKAASEFGLSYSSLQRRSSGEVDIYKVNGPQSVFTEEEEENMALWLSEMAQRGMGYRVCEFLDFVQDVVKKERRTTPFKDDRPGHGWYQAFKTRNQHIIATRSETPLELKRSKLTKDATDDWYTKFRDFLMAKDCIDRPQRIWNCDESGFSMGCKQAKVIGPASREKPTPQVTAGKQRLTVMFCGNASGTMMPPFFVYPTPQPRGYNPLTGSLEGSAVEYTKKGWMDTITFARFIEHFDRYAGNERPVVLLLDSVSSHVNHDVFMSAKEKGIKIYRLVPNATHLMQPLDKGVFGPLKAKWHLTARKFARENPGRSIGKENFAQKLTEVFLQFYKPITVINAFKASGIYPVDSSVITSDLLKPGRTFTTQESEKTLDKDPETENVPTEQTKASGLLTYLDEALSSPIRERYRTRIAEGYDIEGKSPCYDVYRKLHQKAHPATQRNALDVLASVALENIEEPLPGPSTSVVGKLSVLQQHLVYPKAPETEVSTRRSLIKTLPYNLTSEESIRMLSLKELDKVKAIAEREKKAKLVFLNKRSNMQGNTQRKGQSCTQPSKGKGLKQKSNKIIKSKGSCDIEFCKGCMATWDEDLTTGVEKTWVQCDDCNGWIHAECLSSDVYIDDDEPFSCPDCEFV